MLTRTSFGLTVVYVWLCMVLFGSVLFETLVLYPNIFHAVPRSLELATGFMTVRGPGDFFPPAGMTTVITAVATLITGWGVRTARYWLVGSAASLLVGEFLFSVLYFWPRNTILFQEGSAVHEVGFLLQTAAEFESGHWIRLAMSALTAVLAFVGFLRVHRRIAAVGRQG